MQYTADSGGKFCRR